MHNALKEAGFGSTMLVQHKASEDNEIFSIEEKREKCALVFQEILSHLPLKWYTKKMHSPFSSAWIGFGDVLKHIQTAQPDIVHIHSLCGMLKIEDLAKIHKPIVWSLADSWAFTGGCHHPVLKEDPSVLSLPEECKGYQKMCGCCPVLCSTKEKDLSRKVWDRKQKAFSLVQKLTVVGISETIAQKARESQLFQKKEILTIPYPIDTNEFQSIDKKIAREILGLPQEKKFLLIHSRKSRYDESRAFSLLWEALKELQTQKMELLFLGNAPAVPEKLGFPIHFLGNLQDAISRKLLYSAADIFVEPFYQESHSYSILESLACATPVVAFRTDSNSEILQHAQNSYLAKPLDARDIANGIDWICHHLNYKHLSMKAREKACESFEKSKIIKEYSRLYEKAIS